jgi:hypothetical protein
LSTIVKLEPGRQSVARCTRLQSKPRPKEDSPLTPELKEFIDSVVVPILVHEFLEKENRDKKPLACKSRTAPHSHRSANLCSTQKEETL